MKRIGIRVMGLGCSLLLFSGQVMAVPFWSTKGLIAPLSAKVSKEKSTKISTGVPIVREKKDVPLPKAHPSRQSDFTTMLNQEGRLNRTVTAKQVSVWKKELQQDHLPRLRKSQLHTMLGEALLGNQEPGQALEEFRKADDIAPPKTNESGISRYDQCIAEFYQGRYQSAYSDLRGLIAYGAFGFSVKNATLFMKHAQACAGYHDERARAGITEPGRVDPIAGISGVAIVLRALKLPHDENRLRKAIRVTGMGSSGEDILKGAEKLGLVGTTVQASDSTLKKLFELSGGIPVIAHVEHDHFIAITKIDSESVYYVCSDCADWPGGDRILTWKQWRMMEADAFVVLAKKGTDYAEAVNSAQKPGKASVNINLVLPGTDLGQAQAFFASLPVVEAKIVRPIGGSLVCSECWNWCPKFSNGFDPINLATLGEEYKSGSDITIYNPIGPSVSLSRLYNGLSTYASEFGDGWSHPYNVGISWRPDELPSSEIDPRTVVVKDATVVLSDGSEFFFEKPTNAAFNSGGYGNEIEFAPSPTVAPMKLYWVRDPNLNNGDQDHFKVVFKNRSVWESDYRVTTPRTVVPGTKDTLFLPIFKMYNNLGQWIKLIHRYNRPGSYPNTVEASLEEIRNSNGDTLLTLGFDSTGHASSAVDDINSRKVLYSVTAKENVGYSSAEPRYTTCLEEVSQVIPESASSGSAWYQYHYALIDNGNSSGDQENYFLDRISMPNPTGTGMASYDFTYASDYPSITRVDFPADSANHRDYALFTEVDETHTRVSIKKYDGTLIQKYAVGFNSGLSMAAWYYDYTSTSNEPVVTYTYGSAMPGHPTHVEDATGRNWYASYDSFGNKTSETTPAGTVTTYSFDYEDFPLGKLESVQEEAVDDGTKTATTFEYYEPSGLIHYIHSPIPGNVGSSSTQTTTFTYDTFGNVTQIETPGNNAETTHTTTFGYTSDGSYSQDEWLGRPIKVTNSDGKITHFRYTSLGLLDSVTDANSHTTEFEYNIAGQKTETQLPATGNSGSGHAKSVSEYLYPGGPVVHAKQYDEGNTSGAVADVAYTYDSRGRVTDVTGDTEVSHCAYDAANHVIASWDGAGTDHTTEYIYGQDGILFAVLYPGFVSNSVYDEVFLYEYDVLGRPVITYDGNDESVAYTYDNADGLLTNIEHTNDSSTDASFEYDQFGRLIAATDATGTATSTYDDLDNLISATRNYDAPHDLPSKTVSYEYYPDGSRSEMALPGSTWGYSYDKVGRYTSMSATFGSTTLTSSATYSDSGWQMSRTVPGGYYTAYTYNELGMLQSLTNKPSSSSSTVLSSFTVPHSSGNYGYDSRFRLKKIGAYVNGVSTMSDNIEFTYDGKDRLTEETSGRYGGYTESNTFDSSGNPTTFRNASGISYNDDNQIDESGFEYDGNGNPTTYNSESLSFNANNQMTALGSHFEAGYRADGLRAFKHWFPTGSSANGYTYYLYDGGNAVCELDKDGNLVNTNVYAPDGLVASRTAGGTTTSYLFDQQGNTSELMTGGSVSLHMAYNAWGQCNYVDPVTEEGPPYVEHSYNARWGYLLDETGLYYCQNRYYDPGTGRFLTRDPIGYAGGMNLYGYCGGGPVGLKDSNGLQPEGIDGPLHLEDKNGNKLKISCRMEDSCEMLRVKSACFIFLILSHSAWDLLHSSSVHAKEITAFYNGLDKCIDYIRKKRCDDPAVPPCDNVLERESETTGSRSPLPPMLPFQREDQGYGTEVAVGAGAAIVLWEVFKWSAAIVAAPETGGLSLVAAGACP